MPPLGMDGQSENLREPQSAPVVAGMAPRDELETDEVPDSLVSEFSSLTTPYCWVITEDAVAGYDGAEPSAVGKSGPGHAVAALGAVVPDDEQRSVAQGDDVVEGT